MKQLLVYIFVLVGSVLGRNKPRQQVTKDGGWNVERADPRDGLPWGKDFGYCPFPVIDATKATSRVFYDKCFKVQSPCIIVNGLLTWPAIQKYHWHRKNFLRSFGKLKTMIASRSEFPLNQGQSNVRMTLEKYLNRSRTATESLLFDFFEEIKHSNSNLKKTFRKFDTDTPGVFGADGKDLFFSVFPESTKPYKLLSIGRSGGGIDYHTHGDTFLALLFGRKTWYIYPPGRLPSRVSREIDLLTSNWKNVSWYSTQDRKDRPVLCQQKSSQVLYLPQLFHHATENQGEAIGVGWQFNLDGHVVERTARHLLRTQPDNPLALFNLWIQSQGDKTTSAKSVAKSFPFQILELRPNDLSLAIEALKQYAILKDAQNGKVLVRKWQKKLDHASHDLNTNPTSIIVPTTLGSSFRALGYALHVIAQTNTPLAKPQEIARLLHHAKQYHPTAQNDHSVDRVIKEYLSRYQIDARENQQIDQRHYGL